MYRFADSQTKKHIVLIPIPLEHWAATEFYGLRTKTVDT